MNLPTEWGLVAQSTLSPGGVIAWIGMGLVAGWLAGLMMSGGGFGILADIAFGLVGAIGGGGVCAYFINGDAGFWASLLMAFVGAWTAIAIARIAAPRRATQD